jgi:hypothetical protein
VSPTPSRDILLSIPDDWTGPQAMAVVDLLNDLQQAIWEAYERPILDCYHPEADDPPLAETDDWLGEE